MAVPAEQVRRTVFEHKPILQQVLKEHGHLTLEKYFHKNLKTTCPVSSTRAEELIHTIAEKVSGICGQAAGTAIRQYFKLNYSVSTADHHGPIGHPFFLNSNLCQGFAAQALGLPAVVTLTCGSISLNNSSFPRGLLLHDRAGQEQRLHFFTTKVRHRPVYSLPAYDKRVVDKAIRELENLNIGERQREAIIDCLNTIYADAIVLGRASYSDQVTLTNARLWQQLPGQQAVNLFQVEQEEIVRQLLLDHHVSADTIISKLLFDPAFRQLFQAYFKGVTGAFADKPAHGSFLFWSLRDGQRSSFHLKGDKLVTESGHALILEPETIAKALRDKNILPTMALSFIVLSFYYGLRCGGGFSQINYLGDMQRAYLRLLEESGEFAETQVVKNVETSFFCGEFIMALCANKPAHGLDLLPATAASEAALKQRYGTLTLEAAVDGMMGEYYKIITGRYP